jgi:hypothetical protein
MPDVIWGVRWYAHNMVAESSAHAGLLREVRRFAPPSQAPALLQRAVGILGVDTPAPSHRDEILCLCRALAGEGGLVQEMAQEIARELAHR